MRRCDRVLVGLRTSIVANLTKDEVIPSRPEGRRSFNTCLHAEADGAVLAAGGTTWPIRPRSEKYFHNGGREVKIPFLLTRGEPLVSCPPTAASSCATYRNRLAILTPPIGCRGTVDHLILDCHVDQVMVVARGGHSLS